jgi:hypothetical protein
MSDTHHLASQWSEWINEPYTSGEAIRDLYEWYFSSPRRPMLLTDFLRPEQATRLYGCLSRLDLWHRVHSIVTSEQEIEELPPDEWLRYPQEQRWSRQDIVRPIGALFDENGGLPAEDCRTMQEFFFFVLIGPQFRIWLASIFGVPIKNKAACEIARYQPGDFIIEHGDTHDPRMVGINFYLGHDCAEGEGGELGFRNGEGEEYLIRPKFNSLSLIPIHKSCVHWVSPWKGKTAARETICLSYRPEYDDLP